MCQNSMLDSIYAWYSIYWIKEKYVGSIMVQKPLLSMHAELPERPPQYARGGPKSKRSRTQDADAIDEDFANSASFSSSSSSTPSPSNNDAAANQAASSLTSPIAGLGNPPNAPPTMETNQTISPLSMKLLL